MPAAKKKPEAEPAADHIEEPGNTPDLDVDNAPDGRTAAKKAAGK